MTYQRLSRQDTVLLRMESPTVHMQTGSVIILDGALSYDDAADMLAGRLHMLPRARQRLVEVPMGLHRPIWVDDDRFEMRYHLRHVALPSPGSESQLLELAGRFVSEKLDLTRAPWEMLLVDGLEGGRSAAIRKQHHVVTDGVSAANTAAAVLDLTPDAPRVEALPWTPRPHPVRREVVGQALRARGEEARRFVREVVERPGEKARNVRDFVRGTREIVRTMRVSGPMTPLNTALGRQRRLAYVRASLEDFKAIRSALGGTVNDVALTAVTGGMLGWFEHRGFDPGQMPLRVAFPKNLRPAPGPGVMAGNEVSSLFADVPPERDPVRRLELVTQATRAAKDSLQAFGLELMSRYVPPAMLAASTRVFGRNRAVMNVTVTNVPGPPFPLYLAGLQIADLVPVPPLAGPIALMVAVVSYAGRLGFGLMADYDAVPDLDVLALELERSIGELKDAAIPRPADRTAGRA